MNIFLTAISIVVFVISAPAIGFGAAIISGLVLSLPVINTTRLLGIS